MHILRMQVNSNRKRRREGKGKMDEIMKDKDTKEYSY